MTVVGIDVGARRLNVVVLGMRSGVEDGGVLGATDLDALVRLCRDAVCVAIDAPETLSSAPHGSDRVVDGKPLSGKFQRARCAEIGLGMQHGIWVPWATPEKDPPGWMVVGIELFNGLRAAGLNTIEVYPHAGFRALAKGERLARKVEPAGIAERTELLRRSGVDDRWLSLWSHDSLDAALAAVVARDYCNGRARAVTCGHDGSAIWLPAPV